MIMLFYAVRHHYISVVRELAYHAPLDLRGLRHPIVIEQHWYQYLLHNQQGEVLKALLLLRAQERVVVIGVPWYLKA